MSAARVSDEDERKAGWQALVERLGPAGALRFALQKEQGSGDWAALRDEMLGSASVDELVARMRAAQKAGRGG